MDLKNFILKIIDQNSNIFTNFCDKITDRNYKIDNTIIDRYLEKVKCNTKALKFKREIIKNIRLVECYEFETIINKNIEGIVKLNGEGYKICLPIGDQSLKKSNFFYSLLTIFKLKNKSIDFEIFYKSDDVFDKYGREEKVLIVLCDDVSYSGNQLSSHINSKLTGGLQNSFYVLNIGDLSKKLSFLNPNMKYYLNIIGYSETAKNAIEKQFKSSDISSRLIYGSGALYFSNSELFSSMRKYLTEKYRTSYRDTILLNSSYSIIKKDDKLYVVKENIINHAEHILDLSLIILFQKYPDAQSTFPDLCRINILDQGRVFIDTDKLFGDDVLNKLKSIDWSDNNMVLLNDFIKNEEITKNITSNFENITELSKIPFLEICQDNGKSSLEWNYPDKDIKIVKTIKNGEYNSNPATCEVGSIKPFYKELNFILNGTNLNPNETVSQNLKKVNELSNKYYHLYIKYKKKYLKLKNFNL